MLIMLLFPYLGFVIAIYFSALRLSVNVDENQTTSFIGLPRFCYFYYGFIV